MRIVVLLKEVPDTYGDRRLSLETGLADRGASDPVVDEIGERALETALSYADDHPETEVVVLSMGPEGSAATVRKGLAMGAHDAVQVSDEQLRGADLGLTAEALAAAATRTGFDLIVCGNLSTDGTGGVIPAMVAELLGVPHASALNSVQITDSEVTGERASDDGTMRVSASLPAVISITERMADPRFPSFKGIMAAKKKPLEVVSLSELGVDPADARASRSIVISIAERLARAAGITIVDEGDGGEKLADFLVQNRLV